MTEVSRARVLVKGRVQGVFFRAETEDMAASLGLSGYVRNKSDGSVEAVFEGEKHIIADAIDWCRRGPALARVESVKVDWESPEGEDGFRVKYR